LRKIFAFDERRRGLSWLESNRGERPTRVTGESAEEPEGFTLGLGHLLVVGVEKSQTWISREKALL
jgi:hypothetical protein